MILAFAALAIGAGLYFFVKKPEAGSGIGGLLSNERIFDFPDTDDLSKLGKTDFDFYFQTVADETQVPAALLKAHAIMESSLNPKAYRDESSGKADRAGWASRGLMQLLYWPGSGRWAQYGESAQALGNGDKLYEPYLNIRLGAFLIRDNLRACKSAPSKLQQLRDAINMYNTGKKESAYKAPHDYVNRVLSNYEKLIGGKIA